MDGWSGGAVSLSSPSLSGGVPRVGACGKLRFSPQAPLVNCFMSYCTLGWTGWGWTWEEMVKMSVACAYVFFFFFSYSSVLCKLVLGWFRYLGCVYKD